ncbi:MAG TPA: MarR family transcriptional regulator [Streptosporangiaceae bacterium]|nr:MarR family transcriptional regulator [Streptosporangiaceae bacterium]
MTGSGQRANDAWEALLSAHAVLMKQFAAEDIWAEVSMREYDVLYTLSKCPEPVRIGELNRNVLLSQPALSRLVHRLADRGLIECQADQADGRSVRVSLTEAGLALQRQVGRRHARSVARLLTAALDRGDLQRLERIGWRLASQPTTFAPENEDMNI